MNESLTIPLFPLNMVLFPGGNLSLRIFEAHYLDMVSHCLRHNQPFGISLIQQKSLPNSPLPTYPIGTLAKITDWNQDKEGLLNISVQGAQRFKILSRTLHAHRFIQAEVMLLAEAPEPEIPRAYHSLSQLLQQIIEHIGYPQQFYPINQQNITWLSYRLAEILPISFTKRQHLLELEDTLQRLEILVDVLNHLKLS